MKRHFEQTMIHAHDLLDEGQFKKAFAEWTRLPANPAHAPEVIYLQASIAMQLEDWLCALTLLETIMLPNRTVIRLDRAAGLIALNRLDDARTVLENEETCLRNQYRRYVVLARIAALQGDANLAAAHLDTAFQLDQSSTIAATMQQCVFRLRIDIPPRQTRCV